MKHLSYHAAPSPTERKGHARQKAFRDQSESIWHLTCSLRMKLVTA